MVIRFKKGQYIRAGDDTNNLFTMKVKQDFTIWNSLLFRYHYWKLGWTLHVTDVCPPGVIDT